MFTRHRMRLQQHRPVFRRMPCDDRFSRLPGHCRGARHRRADHHADDRARRRDRCRSRQRCHHPRRSRRDPARAGAARTRAFLARRDRRAHGQQHPPRDRRFPAPARPGRHRRTGRTDMDRVERRCRTGARRLHRDRCRRRRSLPRRPGRHDGQGEAGHAGLRKRRWPRSSTPARRCCSGSTPASGATRARASSCPTPPAWRCRRRRRR